jgi:FKBP-type peptidyl-prolyl cis-trans isomerase 2
MALKESKPASKAAPTQPSAAAIKAGDKVRVDYTGTLDDGTVFDSTTHEGHTHPLEFQCGSGQLIKGFDDAVMGMKVGEEKTFTLGPEQAYGDRRPEMTKQVPRKNLPPSPEPQVGMMLALRTGDGHEFPAVITEVTPENVTIDLNHPLAGQKLTFKIKIVGIGA